MRYNDIVNEAPYGYGRFRGNDMDAEKRAFKRQELEFELRHEEDDYRRDMEKNSQEFFFKNVPYELAKKEKLRWSPDKKLWFKTLHRFSIPSAIFPFLWDVEKNEWMKPELQDKRETVNKLTPAPTQAPTQSPAPQGSSDIKMTHLHYFNLTDKDAQDFAAMKLKKDKHGRWYLPQYNKSGQTFQNNFNTLQRTFGQPKSIALK